MSHPDNAVPKTMSAMVLNGNGGMDMYEWLLRLFEKN